MLVIANFLPTVFKGTSYVREQVVPENRQKVQCTALTEGKLNKGNRKMPQTKDYFNSKH
jgi:hypothetical protein